jgi:hypothetical protein
VICWKCGHETRVLATRGTVSVKISRKRQCLLCSNRFTTVEVPVRAIKSNFVHGFEKTVQRRIALIERDVKIAQDLHLGWQHLAQLYNLTKGAVYLAARRGRKHIQLQRK